jgi:hypothetical protein
VKFQILAGTGKKNLACISGGTSIGEIPKAILIFKALAPGYSQGSYKNYNNPLYTFHALVRKPEQTCFMKTLAPLTPTPE